MRDTPPSPLPTRSPAGAERREAPTLAIVQGPRRGTILPLVLPHTLIGRIESNHIVLDDASISRVHARLVLDATGVTVEDLRSTRGTQVNGRTIDRPTPLRDGDEVRVGEVVLVLSSGE